MLGRKQGFIKIYNDVAKIALLITSYNIYYVNYEREKRKRMKMPGMATIGLN